MRQIRYQSSAGFSVTGSRHEHGELKKLMRDYFTTVPLQVLVMLALLCVTYLIQRFWFMQAWRLIDRVAHPNRRTLLQSLLFMASSAVILTVLDSAFGHMVPRSRVTVPLFAVTKLWMSLSFVAVLSINVIKAFSWMWVGISTAIARGRQSFDYRRRAFVGYAVIAAGGIPFVAGSYGFLSERLDFKIRRVQIPTVRLPTELKGLRIVQLSDFHMGDFMLASDVRRAVGMANDLRADLAVVTGDFITDIGDPLEKCIAELSRLRSPLGIWGCNGNHEIYANAEESARYLFKRYGMRLLRQENAEVEWWGAKFNIIGVDYQREHVPYGNKPLMLAGIEPLIRRDIPNILLSHNPNSFKRAAALGIELSLAGHTHGGQVRVEIADRSWSPARFMTDFPGGLYKLPLGAVAETFSSKNEEEHQKSAFLYVNRGLGTIGMPVRLGVSPEITLITLGAVG